MNYRLRRFGLIYSPLICQMIFLILSLRSSATALVFQSQAPEYYTEWWIIKCFCPSCHLLTILKYRGRICDDWGYSVFVVWGKWNEDPAPQSGLGFLLSSPLSVFIWKMLSLWSKVLIRYHWFTRVSTWCCIDTGVTDPGIRIGDPEESSVAESRRSSSSSSSVVFCLFVFIFGTTLWSSTSWWTPAGWSRVG